MALHIRGGHHYADGQFDIRSELQRYSADNYPAQHFADAVCVCGSRHFRLSVDDTEGVAVRHCAVCGHEHPIGDSADYLEDAELEECKCPCGHGIFELTVGVALYSESEAVRWLYLGCRCVVCGLVGCYGDWKNECEEYREFLAKA